ncbi:hypothetical protein MMC17_010140 [Xylographa soralifera]|nr:hypothetical protein [Xylographa soralifera]
MIRDRKRMNEDDINITCFFEELPVRGFSVIVTKHSATLPTYQSTGLNYTHMAMTRFKDDTDQGFFAVTGDLMRWSKRFRNPAQPEVDMGSPMAFRNKPSLVCSLTIPHFPYSRNSDFVGCEDILRTIEARLPNETRLALNGIGGVGKTEIAAEFCYRYYKEHSDVSIFWIPCDNDINIDLAFREVARRLKLPGYDDPKTDQSDLVVRYMSGGEANPWLMVPDNADHIELMTEGKRALARLVPKFRKGFVVLTTRDRYVAPAVVGSGYSSITVNSLCPADAQTLLRSKLPDDAKIDESNELEILEILEYLPLCITQAAAYIDQSEISLHEYWLELTESEASLIEILNDDRIDLRRGFDAPNSVFRAWKLSFEKIRKRYRQAGELLSVMAFLDRQNISRDLLHGVIASRHQLNSALGTLQGFCLIKAEEGQETFGMHRLVQLATKFWLHSNREDHEAIALKLVSGIFPGPHSEDYDTQRQLLRHVKIVVSNTFHDDSSNKLLADLQYKLAAYEWQAGQYDLADKLCQAAYEKRQSWLGGLHKDTLHTKGLLGVIKRYQGFWDEAYSIQKEVLRRKESAFGIDHLDTIDTLSDLADAREQQGRFAEAEEMTQRAYAIRMNLLGKDHPKTLQSLMNLATNKRRQANYNDAEALGRQALQRYEKTLGLNHRLTLTSGYALAGTLRESAQYAEAITISSKVVDGRKRIFGDNHPQTLLAINNLALGHRLNGNLGGAEALYRQVCTTNAKLQRVDHPDNLQAHQCLAQVLRDLWNYDEAEKVGRETLVRRELVLGNEHLSTMNTAENLSLTLDLKGSYEEAESLAKRVLAVRTKGLGESHTYTLDTLFILASIKEHTDRVADAIVDFTRVRDERTRILGPQHPATQKAIQRLQQLTGK